MLLLGAGVASAIGPSSQGDSHTGKDLRMASAETSAGTGPIVGPVWVAEDIGGRGVIDFLQSHVTFDVGGTVSGSGGCNQFTGAYTLEGDRLGVGLPAATSMACPEAIMNQEAKFHAALAAARSYRIESGLLFLLDGDGRTVMRLWPRD